MYIWKGCRRAKDRWSQLKSTKKKHYVQAWERKKVNFGESVEVILQFLTLVTPKFFYQYFPIILLNIVEFTFNNILYA